MIYGIDPSEVDKRQRVNLSSQALDVIKEDMFNFCDENGKETFSGFLNRIFTNFYQDSKSTIDLRINEKKEALTKRYASSNYDNYDDETKDILIDEFIDLYTDELTSLSQSYENGTSESFRINKQNLSILRNENPSADYYDGSLGKYLKAIFEEYSRKLVYEREQIFFAEEYKAIIQAISDGAKLKVTLIQKNKAYLPSKFEIEPYQIIQNKAKTYNYLVGFSKRIPAPGTELFDEEKNASKCDTIKCIRLSNIATVTTYSRGGAYISKNDIVLFKDKLKNIDVEYISGKPSEISVKLTDDGIKLYNSIRYLRPQYSSIDQNDDHIYHFTCTERQIINYFTKFGYMAYVVEPLSLRDYFKDFYTESFYKYKTD